MPCYHPVEAWYSGDKTASGKRRLVFKPDGGFGSPLKVPCGKCTGCLETRAQEWAVRITHEAATTNESCFLTLTYSEEHLPPGENLEPADLVGFFKRLRRAIGYRHDGRRVRYFACGEYGTLNLRPHYHIILFGFDFRGDRKQVRQRGSFAVYTSELLDSLWGLGSCEIGTVTPGSAMYVARYVSGKHDAERRELGRHPEFQRQSQGLGRNWCERHLEAMQGDFIIQLAPDKAIKRKVPRYYDKRRDETYLASLKAMRKVKALKQWRDNTPRRLADREVIHKAKIKLRG